MDYTDLPIPGAKGEDTEQLADETVAKKKQELLDKFVEKYGESHPNLAAGLATALDITTPSTPREAGAMAVGGAIGKASVVGKAAKPGTEELMTRLNNIKNELDVFQPGGGKVHELGNIRAIVNGRLDLAKQGYALDETKLQDIIDRAYKFMYNTK